METNKYILITPCKNEGKNLLNLINSIAIQTIKPVLWIILDDGSTDDTPTILEKCRIKYSWIKILYFKESPRDLGLHLAEVMKRGFDYSINLCKKKGFEYDFLGNLDGDIILPSNFFEKLINEFENNPCLGVASGGTDHIIGNKLKRAKLSQDEPSGGHMLIRRRCFEEIGGVTISYSVDSVLKAKARLKNWQTKRFEDNIAIETRDVSSAEGYWRGKIQSGKSAYFRNIHPMHVLIKSFMYTIKKPYYSGIAYLYGYLGYFIKQEKQIDDPEIRLYFWNKWRKKLNL